MQKMLTSICLALSIAASCNASESVDYHNDTVLHELMETAKKADSTIVVKSQSLVGMQQEDPGEQMIFRTFQETEAQLKNAISKNLVVVWVENPTAGVGRNDLEQALARCKRWTTLLGYKQVVIFYRSSASSRVLFDSERESEKRAAQKLDKSGSQAEESARVDLECRTYNMISVIRGGPVTDEVLPELVSQDEISAFLKRQRVKDRLDIILEKGVAWRDPQKADQLKAFEDFALSLGYKRTIITAGVAFFPIPTIFDSERGGHQKNPYEGFSIKVIAPGKVGADRHGTQAEPRTDCGTSLVP